MRRVRRLADIGITYLEGIPPADWTIQDVKRHGELVRSLATAAKIEHDLRWEADRKTSEMDDDSLLQTADELGVKV